MQVKIATHDRNQTYNVRSHWSGYGHLIPYTPKEIDFLAGFVRPHSLWYLIPAAQILLPKPKAAIMLCPVTARKKDRYKYEHYRELWDLLKRTREELNDVRTSKSPYDCGRSTPNQSRRDDRQ